jgi:hypothetical protein
LWAEAINNPRERQLEALFRDALTHFGRPRPFVDALDGYPDGLLRTFAYFSHLRHPPSEPTFPQLVPHLFDRLRARWKVSAGPLTPPSCPAPTPGVLSAVRGSARYQQLILRTLAGPRSELCGAALDAFASGSLDLNGDERARASDLGGRGMHELAFHGPEGAIFFIWSEFALLASSDANAFPHEYAYNDASWTGADWLHFAARLVRAQHLFWRSFARLGIDGLPRHDWAFGSYHKDRYTPVAPECLPSLDFTSLSREELEVYATRCLAVAMPAGLAAPA